MKSSGLFPRKAAYKRGNQAGGSAGNSSSSYAAPNADGYKEGMLGWRASRRGGGESGQDMMADRPKASNKSMQGSGGFAWDSSCSQYLSMGNGKAKP